MHVKWKTHELVFVTLLAAAGIGSALLQWHHLTDAQLATEFIPRYMQHGGSFNYVKYVLLPQIGSVLLLYGCYWAVNGLILPMLKRISPNVMRWLSICVEEVGKSRWFWRLRRPFASWTFPWS